MSIQNLVNLINTQIVRADTTVTIPDIGASPDATGTFGSLSNLVTFVINLVFGVGIAVALVFLIVCGIKYATSSGDQGKAEEARNCITNAIIGAVVIVSFRLLINLALTIFGLGSITDTLNT